MTDHHQQDNPTSSSTRDQSSTSHGQRQDQQRPRYRPQPASSQQSENTSLYAQHIKVREEQIRGYRSRATEREAKNATLATLDPAASIPKRAKEECKEKQNTQYDPPRPPLDPVTLKESWGEFESDPKNDVENLCRLYTTLEQRRQNQQQHKHVATPGPRGQNQEYQKEQEQSRHHAAQRNPHPKVRLPPSATEPPQLPQPQPQPQPTTQPHPNTTTNPKTQHLHPKVYIPYRPHLPTPPFPSQQTNTTTAATTTTPTKKPQTKTNNDNTLTLFPQSTHLSTLQRRHANCASGRCDCPCHDAV